MSRCETCLAYEPSDRLDKWGHCLLIKPWISNLKKESDCCDRYLPKE